MVRANGTQEGDTQGAVPSTDTTRRRFLPRYALIRFTVIAAFCTAYWFLYAVANDMFFYYKSSVYPTLAATHTPNPYFFLYTRSLFNVYESGVEWFPAGHILLVFLIGESIFSVVLTLLVAKNLIFVSTAISKGIIRKDFVRGTHFGSFLIVLTAALCLSPLDTFFVMFLGNYFDVAPLEIWVINYGYIDNTINTILLLLLTVLWRRILNIVPLSAT